MGFNALPLLGATYIYKGLFKVNSPPSKCLNWQGWVGECGGVFLWGFSNYVKSKASLSVGLRKQRSTSGQSPACTGCLERGQIAQQWPGGSSVYGKRQMWLDTSLLGYYTLPVLMECDFLNCDWPTFFSCGQICNNIDYDSSFAKVEKKNAIQWIFMVVLKHFKKYY